MGRRSDLSYEGAHGRSNHKEHDMKYMLSVYGNDEAGGVVHPGAVAAMVAGTRPSRRSCATP